MRMLRVLALMAVLVLLGMFAYETGAQLAQREVKVLKDEIRESNTELEQVQAERSRLDNARREALDREADLLARYKQDVPTGPSQEIFKKVRERLDDGLAPERLAFVIENASETAKCDGRPDTKRFIMQTALTKGKNSWIGFDNTAIVVTGEGQPLPGSAAYDPAKPVKITFTYLGGKKREAEGKLPLYHSIVKNGEEFRFTITEGDARGLVNVTADRCRYP